MQNSFYQLQDHIRQIRLSSGTLMKFSTFGYMWTSEASSLLVASHTIYTMLEKEAFSEFFTKETWRKYVHPNDLHKLIKAEEELLQTNDPVTVEYRLITETGRHIYVHHHMYLADSKDKKRKIMSIVHNITEHKRADVILESMNEGFFELDENLVFRRINEHAVNFWNLQHKKFIGKEITETFPQIKKTDFHKILLNTKETKNYVSQEIVDPVTAHWLHLSISPYADGLIVTFYDIQTEKEAEKRKEENRQLLEAAKAEKELLKAEQKYRNQLEQEVQQRTKEIAELNAELRNLNTITAKNYVETLRHVYINLETIVTNDAQHLSNSGRANLRRAQAAIQKMNLLTNDINKYLELYDIGINKAAFDPNSNMQDVLKGLNGKTEESNAKIEKIDLPSFSADPRLFTMLMNNLIDNGIKFRKPSMDPVIKINSTKADGQSNGSGAMTNKEYIIISVSDNGIGFKNEDAEKMFELFTQLQDHGRYKGSGIGLAICKKIMEMHGGFITATGEPDAGATIDCYFPI